MIYEHRVYNIRSGKADALMGIFKRLLPLFEEYGGKLIGAWITDIGKRPSFIYIMAFENLAARESFWADVYQSKLWVEEVAPQMQRDPVLESSEISIIKPTEFSPLQ